MSEEKWKIKFYEMQINFKAVRRLALEYHEALNKIMEAEHGTVVLPDDATIDAIPLHDFKNLQKIARRVLSYEIIERESSSPLVNLSDENKEGNG